MKTLSANKKGFRFSDRWWNLLLGGDGGKGEVHLKHVSLCDSGGEAPAFMFQQDNDPKHTSSLSQESDGLLPPQSPDPSPNREGSGRDGPQSERPKGQRVLSSTGKALVQKLCSK